MLSSKSKYIKELRKHDNTELYILKKVLGSIVYVSQQCLVKEWIKAKLLLKYFL